MKKKVFSLKTEAKGVIASHKPGHPSSIEWTPGSRMSASDKIKFNWLADQFFEARGMRPPWSKKELKLKNYE